MARLESEDREKSETTIKSQEAVIAKLRVELEKLSFALPIYKMGVKHVQSEQMDNHASLKSMSRGITALESVGKSLRAEESLRHQTEVIIFHSLYVPNQTPNLLDTEMKGFMTNSRPEL